MIARLRDGAMKNWRSLSNEAERSEAQVGSMGAFGTEHGSSDHQRVEPYSRALIDAVARECLPAVRRNKVSDAKDPAKFDT